MRGSIAATVVPVRVVTAAVISAVEADVHPMAPRETDGKGDNRDDCKDSTEHRCVSW